MSINFTSTQFETTTAHDDAGVITSGNSVAGGHGDDWGWLPRANAAIDEYEAEQLAYDQQFLKIDGREG